MLLDLATTGIWTATGEQQRQEQSWGLGLVWLGWEWMIWTKTHFSLWFHEHGTYQNRSACQNHHADSEHALLITETWMLRVTQHPHNQAHWENSVHNHRAHGREMPTISTSGPVCCVIFDKISYPQCELEKSKILSTWSLMCPLDFFRWHV